jgi:hypothetical protein
MKLFKSCDKPITLRVAHKFIDFRRLIGLISPGILICRGVQKKYDSLNAIEVNLGGSTRSVVKQQVVECNGLEDRRGQRLGCEGKREIIVVRKEVGIIRSLIPCIFPAKTVCPRAMRRCSLGTAHGADNESCTKGDKQKRQLMLSGVSSSLQHDLVRERKL